MFSFPNKALHTRRTYFRSTARNAPVPTHHPCSIFPALHPLHLRMLHAHSRCVFSTLTSLSICFRRFNPSSLTSIAFLSLVRPSHVLSRSPTSSTYLCQQSDVGRQNSLILSWCATIRLCISTSCRGSALFTYDFGPQRSGTCSVSLDALRLAQRASAKIK